MRAEMISALSRRWPATSHGGHAASPGNSGKRAWPVLAQRDHASADGAVHGRPPVSMTRVSKKLSRPLAAADR